MKIRKLTTRQQRPARLPSEAGRQRNSRADRRLLEQHQADRHRADKQSADARRGAQAARTKNFLTTGNGVSTVGVPTIPDEVAARIILHGDEHLPADMEALADAAILAAMNELRSRHQDRMRESKQFVSQRYDLDAEDDD